MTNILRPTVFSRCAKQLENISKHLDGKNALVIAADVTRAIESFQIIATSLHLNSPLPYPELYAANENNKYADCAKAAALLNKLGESNNIIIAVVSREYIEEIPVQIIPKLKSISLRRGEALIIDTAGGTAEIVLGKQKEA